MTEADSSSKGRRGSNVRNGSSGSIGGGLRRPSDGFSSRSPARIGNGSAMQNGNVYSNRRQSETPPLSAISRRTSESLGLTGGGGSRRGSEASDPRRNSGSVDMNEEERRRLSEAGLRRPSYSEAVLNDDTSSLMVGQRVWVDGNKVGRIAYIGEVHFAKGEMAGIHLERPEGKNSGSVGGIMYFQCEPKRGIFSRLYRLTREPIYFEKDEYE